jgi:hypothetical protein
LYGLDVVNSKEAQNLAQIRLHGIPGFPRTFTKERAPGLPSYLLLTPLLRLRRS